MAPPNLHLYGYWASGGRFRIRLVNDDIRRAALIYEGTTMSDAEARWDDARLVLQLGPQDDSFQKAWNSPGNIYAADNFPDEDE